MRWRTLVGSALLATGCPGPGARPDPVAHLAVTDGAAAAADGNPTWQTPPPAAPIVTACASPRLDPGVDLLTPTSVLTDVVGLGDRWAIAWVDSAGVATAKVATLDLAGQILETTTLGSPALEPRLAAAGSTIGTVFLSAVDPARRGLPFGILSAALASVGGTRDLAGSEGFDQTRLALAWNGEVFGAFLPAKSPALLLIRADGTTSSIGLGDGGDLLSGSPGLVGIPGGFAFAAGSNGQTVVKTRAADGRDLGGFPLPATTRSVALTVDPTTDKIMGAAAGTDIQLFDDTGQPTPISTTVGGSDPRVAAISLGSKGGARTTVVAWTGPGLNGILYHVTGVNSAERPYSKTGEVRGGGQRIWLVAAGDSVGMFVTNGSSHYFRLRCQ